MRLSWLPLKIALGKIIKTVLSQKSKGLYLVLNFVKLYCFILPIIPFPCHTSGADHIFNFILTLHHNYSYYKCEHLLFLSYLTFGNDKMLYLNFCPLFPILCIHTDLFSYLSEAENFEVFLKIKDCLFF